MRHRHGGRAVACIVKRSRKDGSASFHVKYVAGDGKTRWERHPTLRDAKARKAEIEHQLARSQGRWAPPARVTVAEYAERWLEAHAPSLRPSTLAEYRRILERDLLPRFGPLALAAISRSQVKAFAAEQAAAGLAAATVRNRLAPLRQLLASALDDELIQTNPAARIRIPGRPSRPVAPPSSEQVERVINAARTPEAACVITVAASLGLRRGEIFGLRWEDLDFKANLVSVRRANDRGVIVETKTVAGTRVVPLFPSARRTLLEQKARSRFKRPQDFVFATAVGTQQNPVTVVERELRHALSRAGLPRLAFRFHDLRHYAVSRLIAQGADILQVCRIAGHADPSITLRIYAHLMQEGLAGAALRFDPLAHAASR